MARRGVRIAAISGLAVGALLLVSVPVRAEIARLTSLPLGKGTATVTWTGEERGHQLHQLHQRLGPGPVHRRHRHGAGDTEPRHGGSGQPSRG